MTYRFALSRTLVILGTLLVLVWILMTGGAPRVYASSLVPFASGTLTCNGTQSATYTPGVTNTPRMINVTIAQTFGPCPLSPDLRLTGGSGSGSAVVLNATCTSVQLTPPYKETYKWNNGQQSTVSYTTTSNGKLVDGTTVIISTGSVIEGLDQGFTATKTAALLTLDATACNTSQGVTSTAGPVTVAFV